MTYMKAKIKLNVFLSLFVMFIVLSCSTTTFAASAIFLVLAFACLFLDHLFPHA